MTDRGTYLEIDGKPAVRFTRTYPHPVERVWAAVSEPAELATWFPSAVQFDPQVGGPITFSGDPHADDFSGTVLTYDPPRAFSFTWGDDELRLQLRPVDGGCELTLVNLLSDPASAARNAAGWDVCLQELDAMLSGTPGGGPHVGGDAMARWRTIYATYVEAGLPAGAPVPPA